MPLYPNVAIPITLRNPNTLAVADGFDLQTIPFNCTIDRVHANIGVNGTTSGQTDFVLAYVAPTGGTTTSGDVWTVAAGVGRIAHDSAVLYQSIAAASLAKTKLEAGGTLALNIDAIPGGSDSSNLTVTVWAVPTDLS
jgi:hypothetical protein